MKKGLTFKRRARGFTLIEIMVVVVIMGVLAALVVPKLLARTGESKIAAAKVPYRVPEAADLPQRLGGVLTVLFLVFNEGYLATGDGDPVRAELTGEAIRLTRVLRQLLPDEPEAQGLLSRIKHGLANG